MSTPPIIIIADRDPTVSNTLRVKFADRHFVVLLAASAEDAEAYAAETVASLIILDIGSLRIGGFDACARIRRRRGYTARPIVLTVPTISAPVTEAAGKVGATSVLAKPYSFADLIRTVLPHMPSEERAAKQLAQVPGIALSTQQEWVRSDSLHWRFGAESGLSGNARLMPVVRAAGVKLPVMRVS